MGLNKLGDYIEETTEKNKEQHFGNESLRGISQYKYLFKTKIDMNGVDLSSYHVVRPNEFCFKTMTARNGGMISLGMNTEDSSVIVYSSWVSTFKIKETTKLLPNYLLMFFRRPEFDRYVIFNSCGSVREKFSFEDMQEVELVIPSIKVQQMYVDAYNAMRANQRAYERGLDDLNIAIAVNLEKIKHTAPRIQVGKLLEEIDVRNHDGSIHNVQGININKEFMPSVANLAETDLTKYKVIKNKQFAYSAMQTGRDECIRIALFHENDPVIISPAYSVLQIMNESVLSEYVMLWFSRSESDRYGWFISDNSIRASLELQRFYEIEIPLPTIPQQQAIVSLYNSRYMIKQNIEKIGSLLNKICPILIKGSLEEAKMS